MFKKILMNNKGTAHGEIIIIIMAILMMLFITVESTGIGLDNIKPILLTIEDVIIQYGIETMIGTVAITLLYSDLRESKMKKKAIKKEEELKTLNLYKTK